mmetsp:Transcript_81790/g.213383  ORF Transcript_81790/g.213383 Transcript_81790/m.213383 type:complete len:221 (+) Transcript_81790:206-868(+)
MPDLIMLRTDVSQSTGVVSCLFSSSTTSFGSVPGWSGCAVVFIHTQWAGGFMLGSSSSRAFPSFSFAGCISDVWKPPEVLRIFACSTPAATAFSCSISMAFLVPAHEKPFGKSSLAIMHTPPGPSAAAASWHSFVMMSLSRPATETMPCALSVAASCIASPRSFTSRRPSSKLKTPAAHSAVYSPRDRPAATRKAPATSGRSSFSFSSPAMPATNIAGWQ